MESDYPLPHNQDSTFSVGDRVRIKSEWQDPGDDEFERVVIEAPEDCTRVLVQTIIPGFTHNPVARIETFMLERVKLGLHIDSEGEVNIEDEVIGHWVRN